MYLQLKAWPFDLSQSHLWSHCHIWHYERFKRKNKFVFVVKSIYFLYVVIYFECAKFNINEVRYQNKISKLMIYKLLCSDVKTDIIAFKINKHIQEINTCEHKKVFIFTLITLIMPNMTMTPKMRLRQTEGPSFKLGI